MSTGSLLPRLRIPVYCCISRDQTSPKPGPDISALDRTLQKQWDHAANLHLGNIVITKHTRRKVWWICDQCPDGHVHQWIASVSNRTYGTGCPQCANVQLCKHNALATRAPAVAALWDDAKNGCTADIVIAGSHMMAHWRCNVCSHEWTARTSYKVYSSTGCPKCNQGAPGRRRQKHPTFTECQHPLLAEWDHAKNAAEGLFPNAITLGSSKSVHWLCTKCAKGQKHSWQTPACNRTSKKANGCPVCDGKAVCKCNSLQERFPTIAAEWDYSKNEGTPNDYTCYSRQTVWWHNATKGSWQQEITKRTYTIVLTGRHRARASSPQH